MSPNDTLTQKCPNCNYALLEYREPRFFGCKKCNTYHEESELYCDWFNSLEILVYGEIDEEYLSQSFLTILKWKADKVYVSDKIPDNKFTIPEYWLLLSLLQDCIEYGTSPRGAWLTPLGESVLKYLNKRKANG